LNSPGFTKSPVFFVFFEILLYPRELPKINRGHFWQAMFPQEAKTASFSKRPQKNPDGMGELLSLNPEPVIENRQE
jgi:hypothetical protein